MEFSLPHLLILLLVVVILFGGRIPEVMRGLGQGIREFKEGMKTDHSSQPPPSTPTTTTTTSQTPPEKK